MILGHSLGSLGRLSKSMFIFSYFGEAWGWISIGSPNDTENAFTIGTIRLQKCYIYIRENKLDLEYKHG